MSPLRHSLGDETGVTLAEALRGRTVTTTILDNIDTHGGVEHGSVMTRLEEVVTRVEACLAMLHQPQAKHA